MDDANGKREKHARGRETARPAGALSPPFLARRSPGGAHRGAVPGRETFVSVVSWNGNCIPKRRGLGYEYSCFIFLKAISLVASEVKVFNICFVFVLDSNTEATTPAHLLYPSTHNTYGICGLGSHERVPFLFLTQRPSGERLAVGGIGILK